MVRSGVMGYTFGHDALAKCNPMEEIIRFVSLAQTDRFTIRELCEQFGISRKTGYKHLERYVNAAHFKRWKQVACELRRHDHVQRTPHRFLNRRYEFARGAVRKIEI